MGIVHATACAEPPPATRLLVHGVVDLVYIMRLMPVKRNDGNRMTIVSGVYHGNFPMIDLSILTSFNYVFFVLSSLCQ